MLTFFDLQMEVARRATKDQADGQFTIAIKNIINTSLFRIAREAPWRSMRRKAQFTTLSSYATGTNYGIAVVTSSSNIVSVANGRFLTDDINIGRKIKFSASSTYYTINGIASETQIVLDQQFRSATNTLSNYEILPQADYTLPMQAGHRMFMWHEDWGFPFKMNYITDQSFYEVAYYLTIKNVPTHYKMWGEDMAKTQVKSSSNISCVSSSTTDISQVITIFGNVAGYPDKETLNLNGTTTVSTTNLFDSVERVVKNNSTVGRITVKSDGGLTTVAILPTGDTTAGVLYKKVFLYPLPNRSFQMNVQYYKDPFRLVNDGDVHELGQEFDEAIILLCTSKLKGETEQSGAGSFFSMWQDEMRSLRRTNMDKIDFFPKLKKPWGSTAGFMISGVLSYGQIGGNGQFGYSSRR